MVHGLRREALLGVLRHFLHLAVHALFLALTAHAAVDQGWRVGRVFSGVRLAPSGGEDHRRDEQHQELQGAAVATPAAALLQTLVLRRRVRVG